MSTSDPDSQQEFDELEAKVRAELDLIGWPRDIYEFMGNATDQTCTRRPRAFSDHTKDEIRLISKELPIDRLEQTCEDWLGPSVQQRDPTRQNLKKLEKSLAKFDATLDECELNTAIALATLGTMSTIGPDFPEGFEDIKKFTLDGDGQHTLAHLAFFRRDVETVAKMAKVAVATLGAQGGRPPKSQFLLFTIFLARICDDAGIKVTKYKDGPYFQVLDLIFRDAIPEIGETAYLRHGTRGVEAFHDLRRAREET